MPTEKHRDNRTSVKGKVIIIFLLGCFALALAWGINNIAFKQMMVAVRNISEPNNRLRLVNELSLKIGQLDQTQRARLAGNKHTKGDTFGETKTINRLIDTLRDQYAPADAQSQRLLSLKKLLVERDKLFISYLKVRETMVNDTSFAAQVQSLNELLDENAKQADSGVISTEKKTSTTIIYPDSQVRKDTRSFFGKLFGKKKQEPEKAYKVVELELNIERDTTAQAIKDSILQSMSTAVERLERIQRKKNARFINRENTLTNANNKLVTQIQSILKQVENEVITQTTLNNRQAQSIVSASIEKTGIIIIAFFVLTILLLYVILTDITRSTRYRKALEQARDEAEYHSRAKQRFLSNMSHEIRTPLQSIFGYAELAREQHNPDERYVEAIYQSSKHLVQIVNEVLDYNRILSGKFTYANQAFNMHQLMEEVVSTMRMQAANKSLDFLSNYHFSEKSIVNGDPFRLKQILYNLLGNAIKFTAEGQVIFTVACVKHEGLLNYSFRITDTGAGLSETDIERIFNEFERVETPGTDNENGTGLGLAITKELVELQGGNITVESEPGKGSVFTAFIKFSEADAIAQEPHIPIYSKQAKKLPSVWVVDDDHFILDLCSLILQKNGIRHKCFNSPTTVLDTKWDNQVHIILTDIRMPELNGKQLCAQLRKKVPADTLIYALTAQALPQEQAEIISAGFDGILTKPFSEHDLMEIINLRATDGTGNDDIMESVGLDLQGLKKMTFDDEKQLAEILHRLIDDTRQDIAALETLLKTEPDTEGILLLVHRLAGRTGQIGAKKLALQLRKIEQALLSHFLSEDIVEKIGIATAQLQSLTVCLQQQYPAAQTQDQ